MSKRKTMTAKQARKRARNLRWVRAIVDLKIEKMAVAGGYKLFIDRHSAYDCCGLSVRPFNEPITVARLKLLLELDGFIVEESQSSVLVSWEKSE